MIANVAIIIAIIAILVDGTHQIIIRNQTNEEGTQIYNYVDFASFFARMSN